MSYKVLARKWRPQLFQEVIGQEHVTQTLINAIKTDRLAHAYLFSGARGVGKTSVARILAKAINCRKGQPGNPCNECHSCIEITNGTSVDVQEIDGASNRGIDEIRELRENIKYMPSSSQFRIYIIDEVHMLTLPAFNALLKTLEEPPPHVKFVFATTEPYKVPITILSRCQRFDFKRIPLGKILKQLETITREEGIEIGTSGLTLLAREAEGSMRDAESLLDQVVSYAGAKIGDESIMEILGIFDRTLVFESSQAAIEGSPEKCMEIVDRIYDYGYDIKEFYRALMDQFRNLLICLVAPEAHLLDMTDSDREEICRQARMAGLERLHQSLSLLIAREEDIRSTSHPRLVLETIMIKLCRLGEVLSFDELLEKIGALERRLSQLPSDQGPPARASSDPQSNREPEGTVAGGPKAAAAESEIEARGWDELLDFLSSKNGAMANVLRDWRLGSWRGDTLEIARANNSFSSSYLDEPERLEKFIDYCREFFRRDLKIKIVGPTGRENKTLEPSERENLSPEKNTHSALPQAVQDILQIFQGEIKQERSIKNRGSKKTG